MIMICGLGNPGLKYRHSRHNAGFDAIDVIAKAYHIPMKKKEKNAITGRGTIDGQEVLLVKPQTFMNKSGESIGELARFYHVDVKTEMLILSDDVSLDAGRIRIRLKGSAGGHNGLKNIIAHCHTEEFVRVRLGVGKLAPEGDMIKHVLTKMSKADRAAFEDALAKTPEIMTYLVRGDFEGAMNRFN